MLSIFSYATCICSLEKCLLYLLPLFQLHYVSFYCWDMSSLHILGIITFISTSCFVNNTPLLSMDSFLLKWQSSVVRWAHDVMWWAHDETVWTTKPGIFSTWPFIEKGCQLLLWMKICHNLFFGKHKTLICSLTHFTIFLPYKNELDI